MLLDTHGITCDRCLSIHSGDFIFYICDIGSADLHLCEKCFWQISDLLDKYANKPGKCELTGKSDDLKTVKIGKVDVKFSKSIIKCVSCGIINEGSGNCSCGGELINEASIDANYNHMILNLSNDGVNILKNR